jgi:peptidoglycan/xylan/chitin deacetylase (PgdA/CDA1 family)
MVQASRAPEMKLQTLMYHDVVEHGRFDASGFPGAGPARYKLGWSAFVDQLDRIGELTGQPPATAEDILAGRAAGRWAITVDDGGESSLRMGQELSRRGWSGMFFVTTGRIGEPAFLAPEAIRELRSMGHELGSHSRSHPPRLSACSPAQILDEWRSSAADLADLLGSPVTTASVPGGYHSRRVVEAAEIAGIRILCTSEPVRTVRRADGCLVLGRFAVHRGVPPQTVAAASRDATPWLRQRAGWTARKAAKAVGGEAYIKARAAVLARRITPATAPGDRE